MIRTASILILSAFLLCGCLKWKEEASALRVAHGNALANAAETNRFDTIPPFKMGVAK